MTYFTIIHFSFVWSKEGQQRYTRHEGNVLLFPTRAAAKEWRDAHLGPRANWDHFIEQVEVLKPKKYHRIMTPEAVQA